MGNPPEPESPAAEEEDDPAEEGLLLLLVDKDLTILSGRLAGEPCGAGLAGMGDGTLLIDEDVTVEVTPPLLLVVTTGRWLSNTDQPLLKLLAELLTGRTDNGLTTTSVESESMAAATLHP